jgi:hypothetical protein
MHQVPLEEITGGDLQTVTRKDEGIERATPIHGRDEGAWRHGGIEDRPAMGHVELPRY